LPATGVEVPDVRTASASRLVITLALAGLVAAAAPAQPGNSGRQGRSAALAESARDQPPGADRPSAAPRRPTSQAATPARPAAKPVRAVPVPRPGTRESARPRLRSTSVRPAGPPRPAAKTAPKPKPRPKPPPPPPPPGGASNSAYESRILALVNTQRTSRGLSPVSMSSCADSYAESWAAHLAVIGALVHRSMSTLLSGCQAQYVGENIGYGPVSADTMMAMWMASPDHRANILNPRFTHVGIGASQTSAGVWYAVQDFLDL
jgi:uncharacterized protein YkwD